MVCQKVFSCTFSAQPESSTKWLAVTLSLLGGRGVFTTRHTSETIKLDSLHLSLNPSPSFLLNQRLCKTATDRKKKLVHVVGAIKTLHEELTDIKQLTGFITAGDESRTKATELLFYKELTLKINVLAQTHIKKNSKSASVSHTDTQPHTHMHATSAVTRLFSSLVFRVYSRSHVCVCDPSECLFISRAHVCEFFCT